MQDLNLLIPPVSGITLVSAVGVDSMGEIVAFGTNASGVMQEYLLTPNEVPAPEPSSLAAFGLAFAGLIVRRARTRRRLPS
jgi:PEP-CTERM motif